jgi:RNA polymerase sigma-54 factor
MVGMKQEFRQAQTLAMTQQLQQSIKLLQLSAVELQEFIDAEMEKNPLLSRDEAEGDEPLAADDQPETGENDEAGEASATDGVERGEITVSDNDYSAGEALSDESYDNDWADDDSRVSAGATGPSGAFDAEEGEYGVESASAREQTLREYLLEQIRVDITDATQQLIAEKLTDMLDEAGYLREDTAALAEQLGVGKAEIERVIRLCQHCEPAGVFARNLRECLALQLADMNRLDPVMETFLDHMDKMGQGDMIGLRRLCGVDDEDFAQILTDIRRCNPKPGSGFAQEESYAVIPDVLVRKGKNGGWLVELNADALPRVLVNRRYAAQVGKSSKEAKKFMSEQMANASWLVKALDQRAQTILKVAEEIVKQQQKFLEHGIRFLKPLVLKDIALAIGMHESTVSRVTTAKYMATPRGTLELKYFFTSSINSAGGATDFSSKTVQYYIKELVSAEDAKKILSDDAIVHLLKDRNIDVARRTVTKYREEMHIPSSVIRRRQKAGN